MHNIKILFILLLASLPDIASGQWRVGATGGTTLNHYVIDKHYMEDWHYDNGCGATFGVFGQYDFMTWKKWTFGVRADLNWAQKNHKAYRNQLSEGETKAVDYTFYNNYLQLPVMANINFGRKLKGFINLGIYGAYWLTNNVKGHSSYGSMKSRIRTLLTEESKVAFDGKRDQRWEFGLIGGIGGEWQFALHWGVHLELRYYRGLTSKQKDYMQTNDPRYNDTFALQTGLSYIF